MPSWPPAHTFGVAHEAYRDRLAALKWSHKRFRSPGHRRARRKYGVATTACTRMQHHNERSDIQSYDQPISPGSIARRAPTASPPSRPPNRRQLRRHRCPRHRCPRHRCSRHRAPLPEHRSHAFTVTETRRRPPSPVHGEGGLRFPCLSECRHDRPFPIAVTVPVPAKWLPPMPCGNVRRARAPGSVRLMHVNS